MALTTTAAVKGRLFESDSTPDTWDDLIDDLVLMAESEILGRLDRQVEEDSFVEYYDGTGGPILPLRQGPLDAVTRVDSVAWEIDGAAPSPTPTEDFNFHTGGLRADGFLGPGWLVRVGGVWTRGTKLWKVSYDAGFATVPAQIEQAATAWTVYLFLTRDQAGLASKVMGDFQQNQLSPKQMSDALDRALSPYRAKSFG